MNIKALSWLERLLEERLGVVFTLKKEFSKLFLSPSGANGYIVFDYINFNFYSSGRAISFKTWLPESEGFSSVIGGEIPMPGPNPNNLKVVEKSGSNYVIHYDILGLIYWMLTRLEEIGSGSLDGHGRFSAYSSHAYKYRYLDRPIVDEWIDILKQVIEMQWPELRIKQRNFSVKVSHDVDLPSRYGFKSWSKLARIVAGDLLKRRDLKSLIYSPLIKIKTGKRMWKRDPYNTMDMIMGLSEKYGLKSAFYFICGKTDLTKDADYTLDHIAIKQLILDIYNRGHEIGVHPSYATSLDSRAFHSEVDTLRSTLKNIGIDLKSVGGRMHYLRFTVPDIYHLWGENSFLNYDSSLGYADHSGFRAGTSIPYSYFDPVSEKEVDIIISPLIAMEVSIISKNYQNLGLGDEALDEFLLLKERCRKVGGNFTLLWHNSNLVDEPSVRLYENVLRG